MAVKPDVDARTFAAIDAYIEGQMRRLKLPGAALAVIEGDRIVYQCGYGRARPGGEAPSPHTPFVLGSITKSITALAVMQLVEAGKVELDASVQRYLPWFRVVDVGASARMTVRCLLNQTSGLPMLAGMIPLADLDDSPGALERQARALSALKLSRPVGAAFEYSNLNYNLLGLIVEAASGQPYAAYVQAHIFDPLAMTHSYTVQAEARQNGLAVGHRYWFGYPLPAPDLPMPRGSLPSGQLISCAEDMAHYLIAHLNGGRWGDAQILSPAGMDELHRGVADEMAMGEPVGKYGMGWFVSDLGGTPLLWHGGNVPDFSSYMALLPEQRKGFVLLTNADHGLPMILPEAMAGLVALLDAQPPVPGRFSFLLNILWATRGLLLIPLLQIADVAVTLRLLRRWEIQQERSPGRGRALGLHILLPLMPHVLLAATGMYLRASRIDRFLSLFMPDVFWITRICGSFAGIWAALRTGLVLRSLRGRTIGHE